MDFNVLKTKLNNSSKLQKFSIYLEIIRFCYLNHDLTIFKYYEQLIDHLAEYLEYDDIPTQEIKDNFTLSIRFIFACIKNISDKDRFYKYFPDFEKYNYLIENPVQLAHIYQSFGYLFWYDQDLESSKKYLRLSLELINKESVCQIPNRYTNLGYLYEYAGDLEKAEEYYLQGINFAQREHYQEAMFMAYNAMGRLYLSRNLFTKAQHYFLAALDIIEQPHQNQDYISTLMNLASTYVYHKNYQKAIECIDQVQQDWLKKENPILYYYSFINKSIYYKELGKLDEADRCNALVLEFAQNTNNYELLYSYYYNQGQIELNKANYQKAVLLTGEALVFSRQTGNLKQQSLSLNLMAQIYMKLEEFSEALKHFADAEVLTKKLRNDAILLEILHKKASCLYFNKDFKKAYTTLDQFCKLKQKLYEETSKSELSPPGRVHSNSAKSRQFIFKTGYTIISKELTEKIGVPLIGQTPTFKKIVHQALLIADNISASVLIKGESGTGKELIARLIHFASDRKRGPFIPVNSASFTDGLAQSTLFGHEKGAFTSAINTHKGYFEQANGGTIFLDEISEMPLDIQANLLRILEDKKIRRLGADKRIDADFRLISASNRNIDKMVADNLFRLDLLNRINTLEINIPPLRDRVDDIPLFIDFYLQEISKRLNRKKIVMEAAVISNLLEYDFPGNVRELVNIIEKLVIFSKNDFITEDDLYYINLSKVRTPSEETEQILDLKTNEIKLIRLAMKKSGNIQANAAKLLGISPYALNRRLKKIVENN